MRELLTEMKFPTSPKVFDAAVIIALLVNSGASAH